MTMRMASIAAAVAAFCVAAPASAVPMRATVTGLVSSNLDNQLGMFGTDQSLAGLGFSLVFIYDPETPGARRVTTAVQDLVSGGSGAPGGGTTSPIASAALTINDHTVSIDPANWGEAYTNRAVSNRFLGISGVSSSVIGGKASVGALDFLTAVGQATRPPRLDDAIPFTYVTGGSGNFSFLECTLADDLSCGPDTATTSGDLRVDTVRVAAVPVPAALPLLAFAVAALGLLRRYRRVLAHA